MTTSTSPGLDALVDRHGPAPKQLTRGTHRTVSPADTVARMRHHFDRTGITRVANITGLDHVGVPVVMVTRPNSRGLSTSQGKGLTLDAARASGIMECLELWHGEHLVVPTYRASTHDMQERSEVIDLERVPRTTSGNLDLGAQVLWVRGRDVTTGREVAVPESMVGTDRTCRRFPEHDGILSTSNGLASGNHPLEAIAHGLFEVVERDATTLFSFADETTHAGRRIDLGTVDDRDCREVLDRCSAADVSVVAWDVTSDIGLPTIDCVLFDTVSDPWRPIPLARGQGAHPCRAVAMLRAVTEAAQDRLTLIAGSRDDTGYHDYENAAERLLRDWADSLAGKPSPVRFDEIPDVHHETVAEDVSWLLDRLRGVGLDDAIVVDVSHPDLNVPVWRTVVPGLEYTGGDVAGYRPGERGRAVMAQAGDVPRYLP